MKIKRLLMTLMLTLPAFSLSSHAQFEFGTAPDIHVEGNQLVDPKGHPVRFFGYMDTPSTWFNNGRWGGSYDDAGITRCKNYYKALFAATTDTVNGTYCNLFRLHLEPAWVDDGSKVYCQGFTQKDGKTYDPDGQEVGGEANIHHRSIAKLKTNLTKVFLPIAESAHKEGMYVIMRPPGVCPGTIRVGNYYQQFLIDVWDAVTKNATVKKNSGWLSIELANEPVRCVAEDGKESKRALHDFFQPVVDKIRENGFEGIIWVPGTGWQSSYADYKDYPIEDANFGYAVHNYTGWYGGSDESYDRGTTVTQYCNQFHNQVPVVDTNPIVITEVDWSPKGPNGGHTNEHGDWVEGNYGTWATGSTSKWGKLYKGLLDKYDNISMTLTSTDDYFEVDGYWDKSTYRVKKNPVIKPAFSTNMERDGLDPFEACGAACFQWYKEYYWQQKLGYSDANITMTDISCKTKNINTCPGGAVYVNIEGKFASGRKGNVAASCTYAVADPNVAKVFRGKVIGVGPGETEIVATYKDITGAEHSVTFNATVVLFPFQNGFNPAIKGSGSCSTLTATRCTYKTVKGGFGGWDFGASGVNLSEYDTLTVTLSSISKACKAVFCIYDQQNLDAIHYELEMGTDKLFKIPLKEVSKTNGASLNLRKICIVGIASEGAGTISITGVEVSKKSDENAIIQIADEESVLNQPTEVFNINGMRVRRMQQGLNIIRTSDGKTKKVLVR